MRGAWRVHTDWDRRGLHSCRMGRALIRHRTTHSRRALRSRRLVGATFIFPMRFVTVTLLLLLLTIGGAGAQGEFPVKHSADKRYLVDQNGVPFPILGRTAWFVTSLPPDEWRTFIDDSVGRG